MHETERGRDAPGQQRSAEQGSGQEQAEAQRNDVQPCVVPKWMRQGLHDLCQPLTAMECRLYLTQMDDGAGQEAELREAELRAAIVDVMTECRRMTHLLRAMQERLHEAESPEAAETDGRIRWRTDGSGEGNG